MRINNFSMYRFLAPILIFVFHIYYCLEPSTNMMTVLFSKCVQGLTVLSGILYGMKTIKDTKTFYIKNFKKILLPVVVTFLLTSLMVFGFMLYYKDQNFFKYWFGNATNGTFLFVFGNLWYVPMILLCYLMTPLLQKVRDEKKIMPIIIITLLMVLELMLPLNNNFRWYPFTFIFYVAGFFVGSSKMLTNTLKGNRYSYIFGLVSLILNIVIFFLYKRAHFFGVMSSYMSNFLPCLFGFLSFFTFTFLTVWLNKIKHVEKLFKITDKLSYEFYIVNQMFMTGFFVPNILIKSVKYLAIVLLSLVMAISINVVSKNMLKIIDSKTKAKTYTLKEV